MATREELFAEYDRCLREREDAYEESNRVRDKYIVTGSAVPLRDPMPLTAAAFEKMRDCDERLRKAEEAHIEARNRLMSQGRGQ